MNNTLRYALAMVFSGFSMATVFSQEEHSENHAAKDTEVSHSEPMTVEPTSEMSTNFPDIPANHWAYEAIAKLKVDDIIKGYPDGLFRGPRVPTRYEMAFIVNSAYTKLMSMHSGLDTQIKSLEEKINGVAGKESGIGGLSADVKALRDQLQSVQSDLKSMKNYSESIENLKKLADTFKDELSKMGVDVSSLKKDLSTLEARVGKLEARRHTIDFRGDANFVYLGGYSDKGKPPAINSDGRLIGTQNAEWDYLGRDCTMYHEVALTMSSTNETGPKFRGTIVAGNFLSNNRGTNTFNGMGTQSWNPYFTAFGEPSTDLYIQDLSVKFDSKFGGIGMEAEFGRIGVQAGDHLFKKPRSNYYLMNNPRWNNGNHIIDGVLAKIKYYNETDKAASTNGVQLNLFAGRNSEVGSGVNSNCSINGVAISPIYLTTNTMGKYAFIDDDTVNVAAEGLSNVVNLIQKLNGSTSTIDVTEAKDLLIDEAKTTPAAISVAGLYARQTYGAHLYIPFGKMGEANLAAMLFQTNRASVVTGDGTKSVNRVGTYGGDVKFNLTNNISVKGAYGKTPLLNNNKVVFNKNNDYMLGTVGFNVGKKMMFNAGYRQIKENYVAPGAWEDRGIWGYTVTGVRGFVGDLTLQVSPKMWLKAYGAIEDDTQTMLNASNNKVRPRYISIGGDVTLAMTDKLDITLGGKRIQADQKQGNNKAAFNWLTAKLDYHFGSAIASGGFQYCNATNAADNYPALGVRGLGNKLTGGQGFVHVIYKF